MKYDDMTVEDVIRDRLEFVAKYKLAANASDGSEVDSNANITKKTLCSMKDEFWKKMNIIASRKMMHDKISEMFDKELADDYIYLLENHYIYAHDESHRHLGLPYCASVSIYPMLIDGLNSFGGISSPPKHLSSFSGQLPHLLYSMSGDFCGALATAEWLVIFDYFAKKDFGKNYLKASTKEINQCLQNTVYSINQPSIRAGQSLFWNISIYDKHYLKKLFGDMVFQDGTSVDLDSTYKLQKYFMTWFRKEREQKLLTFPVVTAAYLKDKETGEIKDEKFLDIMSNDMSKGGSFFHYISDSPDAIASCCFHKDTDFITSDGLAKFSDFSHGDPLLVPSHTGRWRKAKVYEYGEQYLQKVTFKNGTKVRQKYCTKNHTWKLSDKTDTNDLKVGDKLLKSPENFCFYENEWEVKSIEEIDKKEVVWCLEVEDDHSFLLSEGIVTGNCRLKNKIDETEKNEFSYSLGSVAVQTGSLSVITINLNRIVQDKVSIDELVDKIHKFQVVYKSMVQENIDAGLLPSYTAGYINVKKQYLTIGLNGHVEACEHLGFKANPNDDRYIDFMTNIVKTIASKNKITGKNYNCKFNTELIPGENVSVKMYKWDKRDGYIVPELRNCYSSYLYAPEDTSITILDKAILHGSSIIQNFDGGSAYHCNLGELPSKEFAKKLITSFAKNGVEYWCPNTLMTICNGCGKNDYTTRSSCVHCGSNNVDYATRIIGYLKKVSSFSGERQIEESKRFYHK